MINKKLYLILIVIILIVFVYFTWFNFFSQEAKLKKEFEKQYNQYLVAKNSYEEAMKQDVYGGKTPDETLKLFIDALKKEDVELASKYFALETNTQDPNYLSRNKWINFLNEIKSSNKISELVFLLEKAKPVDSLMENYFVFEIRDDKGNLLSDVNLKFNQYSKVWKIESF